MIQDALFETEEYVKKLYDDYVKEARLFMRQLDLEHAALSNSAMRYRYVTIFIARSSAWVGLVH